ncbi:colicin immunity domain-containing protein [Nocardia brasiliensis]|uniref:colicin immunity domain-containing protein n=1 Tax=Nocardia brasiliensis TaxID=37326 RepID=UPI0033F46E9C
MNHQNNAEPQGLALYEGILRRFISGETDALTFESEYLTAFKSEKTRFGPLVFDLLDALFADVDDYVSDAQLRAEAGGLDDEELRQRASATYRRLFPDLTAER